MASNCHNTSGLPEQRALVHLSLDELYELEDSLTLALDVSQKDNGEYTQQDKELRRYLRAAKRYVASLIGGAA